MISVILFMKLTEAFKMFDYSFFDKIYDRTNTSAIKYTDLPEAEKSAGHEYIDLTQKLSQF